MKHKTIAFAIYFLVLFSIYHQVVHFNFINYDDQDYVTENQIIQKGLTIQGIKWAFSLHENNLTYWHPLTYIAHMVDCSLFGMKPGYHHLSNVVIHFINTCLLFLVLLSMTGAWYRSFFAALLFAVHPIAVDSVAWIAQKKTLLATFFFLLTILTYFRYTRYGGYRRYLYSILSAAAGLLTKPLMVTIPFVLLILDYWPIGRMYMKPVDSSDQRIEKHSLKRLVIEKNPYAVLCMLWGITPLMQKHVTAKNISLAIVPFSLRFKNAVVSYFMYLKKFIYPVDLALLYPYPDDVADGYAFIAVLFVLIIFAAVFAFRKKYPYLLSGWLVFTLTLIPFLGFVQGAVWPAYADRFAYLPFTGLYVIVSWGLSDVITCFQIPEKIYTSIIAVLILILSSMTFLQAGYWRDNIRLYNHALSVTKNNYLVYNNLGVALDENGEPDEAVKNYEMSLFIKPGFSKAHHNFAINALKRGDMDMAVRHFLLSIQSNPDNPVAKYNLGNIAMANGKLDEAVEFYTGALADKPDFSDAHNNLGVLLLRKGSKNTAMEHFRQALIANPSNIDALCNLGNELFDTGRLEDAVFCFSRAYGLDPKNIRVLNDFGVLYAAMGRYDDSEKLLQEVLYNDPQNSSALANLDKVRVDRKEIELKLNKAHEAYMRKTDDMSAALAYTSLCISYGHGKDAEAVILKILTMNPCSIEALKQLSGLYERSMQYGRAVTYYNRMAECRNDLKKDAYYSIACLFSLENRPDDAVRWLQKAADSGFDNWILLESERCFDRIRKSKPFIEFISVVHTDKK